MYCTEIKKNKSSYEIIEVNYEKVNDEDLIHTMMTIVNIVCLKHGIRIDL